MNLTTVTSRAAAALVAAVAGFASYRHIYDVATEAGEHQGVAAVLPLAIDGLILVATLAMLDDKRQRRRPRLSARVALGFGVAATLAANVASAQPTVTARLVAAVPAVSFLLAVEVLARSGKPLPVAPVAELVDEPEPAPVASLATEPAAKPRPARLRAKSLTSAQKVAKAAAKLPAGTLAQIAAKAGVSESTARRYLPSPSAPDAAETRVNGTPVGVSA